MIGIIGAMDIEVESIKMLLTDKEEKKISGVSYVQGKFEGRDVVVAKCGIGKVFAAICAEAMILNFAPDMIINVGVAGCLSDNLGIGDIVIAQSVVQHDMDTTPLGDEPGMLSDIKIINIPADKHIMDLLKASVEKLDINCAVGVIASGDQFVASSEKKKFITDNFDAKACEMEGASIGQVCYVNKVPFGILRAMSDTADGSAHMDFPEFAKMAAANSTNVIKEFLKTV